MDNDSDGDVDCDDTDCADDPACTTGGVCSDVTFFTAFGSVTGTTSGTSEHSGSCSGGAGPEEVWGFRLTSAGTVCLDTFGSTFDTQLHVRTDCEEAGTEVVCNDDTGSLQSQVEIDAAGLTTYYVFVDGFGSSSAGDYTLTLTFGACDG